MSKSNYQDVLAKIEALRRLQVLAFFKEMPEFKDWSSGKLSSMLSGVQILKTMHEQVIIDEGDLNDYIYFVHFGIFDICLGRGRSNTNDYLQQVPSRF